MNPVLKVVLIVVLTLIALKLLPIIFGLVLAMGGLLGGVALAALAIVALVIAAVLALAVLLSPIWLPVIAVAGIVALCRRNPGVRTA